MSGKSMFRSLGELEKAPRLSVDLRGSFLVVQLNLIAKETITILFLEEAL